VYEGALRVIAQRLADLHDSFEFTALRAGNPNALIHRPSDLIEERANLYKYWAEIAREYLGAAGGEMVYPIQRELPPDALYRSAFLDELFAKQSIAREFARDDGLILDIEPCHGRIHERMRNGFLPPPGYELVKNRIRQQSAKRPAVFDQYLGSPRLGDDFRKLQADVTTRHAALGAKWRHRGDFNFLERQLRTLRDTSAYLCHESDRSVRVGQLAFFVAFARRGAKIIPTRLPEIAHEVRLAIDCFLPELDAYRNFRGTAEQEWCVAAHVVAADLFFDLVDESGI
jgi:hypothetical protein